MLQNKLLQGKIVLLFVCLLAFFIRVQSINQMGRAMDEDYILEKGFKLVDLFQRSDFSNSYWWSIPDHPPLGNYIYGVSAKMDAVGFDPSKKAMDRGYFGVPVFPYNLTFSRLMAILFSILTVYISTYISMRYFGKISGLATGIILSTIPFFVGLSQNANLDIIFSFFFTASISFLLLYIEKPTLKKAIFLGFLIGCLQLTKQTGIVIYPILFSFYVLQFFVKKSSHRFTLNHVLLIVGFSFTTLFLLWPMPFLHFNEYINFTKNMWLTSGGYPEWFLGHLRITPIFYYVLYFLISIPIALLFLFAVGLKSSHKSKKTILYQILLWFFIPLIIQSFYKGRQHQLRYVIEIYAPFAIIAGFGFSKLLGTISPWKKTVGLILLFTYCLLILAKISPYYLDYFNEIVGGTNTVFKNKSFQMGFGGQGLGEATNYLRNVAKKGSVVAVCADPSKNVDYTAPFKFTDCDVSGKADYIIVNYYIVIRDGFMENTIGKKYKLVYTVYADKAELVHVYKKI